MKKKQYLDLQGLNELISNMKSYVSNQKVLSFPTKFSFPTVGQEQVIYIDETDNKIYRWDNSQIKYDSLGFNTEEEIIIDCGDSVSRK